MRRARQSASPAGKAREGYRSPPARHNTAIRAPAGRSPRPRSRRPFDAAGGSRDHEAVAPQATIRKRPWLLLALAAAAPLPAVLSAEGEAPGRFRAELRSPQRVPIAGAQVAAVRNEAPAVLILTVSNDAGLVAIDGVPPGLYEARGGAIGFLPGAVRDLRIGGPFRSVSDFTLRPGSGAPEDLALPGRGEEGRMTVSVTGEDGKPLGGVLVRMLPEGHRADPSQARTDPEGRAVLGPLQPGTWRLSLQRAGWTTLAPPRLRWPGGEVSVIARLLPALERATPAPEELLPPPRLLPPSAKAPETNK